MFDIKAGRMAGVCALLLVAAGSPAAAARTGKGEAASQSASSMPSQANSGPRYCFARTATGEEIVTGSAIRRQKECHSAEEWRTMGVFITRVR